jgi:hypothetical protein
MIKLLNLWSRTFLAELTMLQPVKKLNLSVYFKHQEIIKKNIQSSFDRSVSKRSVRVVQSSLTAFSL